MSAGVLVRGCEVRGAGNDRVFLWGSKCHPEQREGSKSRKEYLSVFAWVASQE